LQISIDLCLVSPLCIWFEVKCRCWTMKKVGKVRGMHTQSLIQLYKTLPCQTMCRNVWGDLVQNMQLTWAKHE
jgi:hypothetical protein